MPVEVVEHRLSEEEMECPICGETMAEIGKVVRRTLKIVPAQVSIREDWYYTYTCRRCQNEGTKTPVVKSEKAPAVISGSLAGSRGAYHGPEILHGQPPVPSGAGVGAAGREAEPTDHEQLDSAVCGGLAEAEITEDLGSAGCKDPWGIVALASNLSI